MYYTIYDFYDNLTFWFSYGRVSMYLNNANTISLKTLQYERISDVINQFGLKRVTRSDLD